VTVLHAALIVCGAILALLLYGCYRLGLALRHVAEARESYLRAAERYEEAADRLPDVSGYVGRHARLRVVRGERD
jgi:hypothetical protein